jgi:ArsR family transcriptional regulator
MTLAAALEVQPVTQLLKALADDTRLRIVALLTHGELCVCHVQAALDLAQPNASRHFGILRAAGVVTPRRDGTWTYYRLSDQDDPDRRRLLASLVAGFAGKQVLRRDVKKLRKSMGPSACP